MGIVFSHEIKFAYDEFRSRPAPIPQIAQILNYQQIKEFVQLEVTVFTKINTDMNLNRIRHLHHQIFMSAVSFDELMPPLTDASVRLNYIPELKQYSLLPSQETFLRPQNTIRRSEVADFANYQGAMA